MINSNTFLYTIHLTLYTINEFTHDNITGSGLGHGLLCGICVQRTDLTTRLCASLYQTIAYGIAIWRIPRGNAIDRLFRG